MLLVKTKIGLSKIHGIGLFADQLIPKNTVIWKFAKGFDIKLTEDQLNKLPQNAQDFIQHYCYHSIVDNTYVVLFDDARFFNHSNNPNVISVDIPEDPEGMEVASHDIEPGEELLCDCREFDIDCAQGKEEYVKD